MDALPITASKPDLSPTLRIPSLAKPDIFQALLAESTARQESADAAWPEARRQPDDLHYSRDVPEPGDLGVAERTRERESRARDLSRRETETDAKTAGPNGPDRSDQSGAAEPAEEPGALASEPSEMKESESATAADGDAQQADASQGSGPPDTQTTDDAASDESNPIGLPQPALAQVATVALTQAQAFANQAAGTTAAPGANLPETAANQAIQATTAAAANANASVPSQGVANVNGDVPTVPPTADGPATTANTPALAPAAAAGQDVAAASGAAVGAPVPAKAAVQPGSGGSTGQVTSHIQGGPPTGTSAQQDKPHGDGSSGSDSTPHHTQQTATQTSGNTVASRAESAPAAFARAFEASRSGEPASQPTTTTTTGNAVQGAGGPGMTVASARAAANVQAPMQAANSPLPGEQIAVRIQRAVGLGEDRIRIRLHPAELGQVDIRLHLASDGSVKVAITADRADTLDMLQRDARGLERALQDAGLKTETGSLNFSLRDGGQHGLAGQQRDTGGTGRMDFAEGTASEGDSGLETTAWPTVTSNRALDITV